MDGERFDTITRQLTAGASRRGAVRLLAGGALGGLLGLRGRGAGADHGCRHAGRACSRDAQCCSGDCRTTCRCTHAGQCPQPAADEPCKKAVCTATGKCTFGNKVAGRACPDDGNVCTSDTCNESGECTHLNRTGEACTTSTCEASTCSCQDGTCAPCTPSATPCSHAAPGTCCSAICASAHQVPGCPQGADTCCV